MPTYNIPFIRAKLVMALTEHDRKQSKKSSYNPYALSIYFRTLDDWEHDPETNSDPFAALAKYFTTCYDEGKEFSIRPLNKMINELKQDARSFLVNK